MEKIGSVMESKSQVMESKSQVMESKSWKQNGEQKQAGKFPQPKQKLQMK